MTCDEVMEFMQRHLDGDLNNEEHKRMGEHLDSCPECADMMERLTRIDQDLARLPKVAPAYSLVDAILPRLAELDAGRGGALASGAQSGASAEAERAVSAPRSGSSEGQRTSRPWYARGGMFRYGGMAAAAVVLGVLVVNGLTDSFEDSRRSMNDSASSGAAAPEIMMSLEAPSAEPAARSNQEAAPKEMASSAADDRSSQPASDGPQASSASSGSGSTSSGSAGAERGGSGDKSADPVGASGASAPPAASEPAPSAAQPGTMQGGGGSQGNVGKAGTPNGNAASGDVPVERLEPAQQEGGNMIFGIASSGGSAEQENSALMDQSDGVELFSDDGAYAASVRRMPDGTLAVHVNQIRGDGDYTSVHRWAAGAAAIELASWNGAVVTYKVTLGDGAKTFAIDAASGTETEIE